MMMPSTSLSYLWSWAQVLEILLSAKANTEIATYNLQRTPLHYVCLRPPYGYVLIRLGCVTTNITS